MAIPRSFAGTPEMIGHDDCKVLGRAIPSRVLVAIAPQRFKVLLNLASIVRHTSGRAGGYQCHARNAIRNTSRR